MELVFQSYTHLHGKVKGEGKFHPIAGDEVLGARWGGWSKTRPGRSTPEKDPVPIV